MDFYAAAVFGSYIADASADTTERVAIHHYDRTPATLVPTPVRGFRSDKGVTFAAGKINRWADQTGATTITQPVAAKQPVLAFDDGRPVVRFTAADSTVLVGTHADLDADYSVLHVRKFRNAKPAWTSSWSNGKNDLTNGQADAVGTAGHVGLFHWGVNVVDWGAGTAAWEKAIYRYTGGNGRLQFDGADDGVIALGPEIAPTDNIHIGATYDDGTGGCDVDMIAWRAWTRSLTDVEVAELDALVRLKHGI